MTTEPSVSTLLQRHVCEVISAAGGWLPFDRYMALALYAPGLGYYANAGLKFGAMPEGGSDFVTAPELSPLFGRALALQVRQAGKALRAASAAEGEGFDVWEFGAGSGALAAQLLAELGDELRSYRIVELSAVLRQRQQERLAPWAGRVRWHDTLPEAFEGVLVGNEVLDAMPVQLLLWDGHAWFERGVVAAEGGFGWAERPTALRPPAETGFVPGSVIEIHPQAEAFIRTLAQRLTRGAAFFIDYGFPETEYYHPQRTAGTLVCHRAHRVEVGERAPLDDIGLKDITAHVNFSALALAGQDAGLDVVGYTTQAHFLMNCGLLALLQDAGPRETSPAMKLLHEHEMGELFKVLGFARGLPDFEPLGFSSGDRSHML
jgi:SAM-dependent MidA family methyltransferase